MWELSQGTCHGISTCSWRIAAMAHVKDETLISHVYAVLEDDDLRRQDSQRCVVCCVGGPNDVLPGAPIFARGSYLNQFPIKQ